MYSIIINVVNFLISIIISYFGEIENHPSITKKYISIDNKISKMNFFNSTFVLWAISYFFNET